MFSLSLYPDLHFNWKQTEVVLASVMSLQFIPFLSYIHFVVSDDQNYSVLIIQNLWCNFFVKSNTFDVLTCFC